MLPLTLIRTKIQFFPSPSAFLSNHLFYTTNSFMSTCSPLMIDVRMLSAPPSNILHRLLLFYIRRPPCFWVPLWPPPYSAFFCTLCLVWPLGYTASSLWYSLCPEDVGQMTGSSATDVCLSAGAACISSLCLACTATDLPSGECGGGDWVSLCVCTIKTDRDTQTKGKKRATARLDAHCHTVIHLLVHCKQMHTKARARADTQTFTRHTHSLILFPKRPWGQWDRASLRVWFVRLFTSNYRNRTISATTAPVFL